MLKTKISDHRTNNYLAASQYEFFGEVVLIEMSEKILIFATEF